MLQAAFILVYITMRVAEAERAFILSSYQSDESLLALYLFLEVLEWNGPML